MATLAKRLQALEAIVPPMATTEAPRTDWEALRGRLSERFAAILAPAPCGTAGVRYWREKIADAEAQATMTPPKDEVGKTNFAALRIAFASKGLPGHRWELRGAELEVLAAEGFDSGPMAGWRAEHDRWRGLPWQWRGEALPADALAVIEAALASENSEGMHDEHDEEAE